MGSDQIGKSWRYFLIEVTFAKNYKAPYVIQSTAPAPNNPILDDLLPSLLVVKLASLIDEALSEYIDQRSLLIPRTYRADFNGRINFLRDGGYLENASQLHQLRELRNNLAHEFGGKATWRDLDNLIDTADHELQHLRFVGERPKFEIHSERVPAEPADPKYLMSFNFSVTLKADGRKAAEFTWGHHIRRDDE